MNPFDLLKNLNINELKEKGQKAMDELKEIIVTGTSGGEFVKVTINGEFNILSIEYEESDIIKGDLATFRDLIIAAHNDAVSKVREEIQKKLGNVIPGFSGLSGLFG
jgi:DNA-binding YbaB/EbfC family protein